MRGDIQLMGIPIRESSVYTCQFKYERMKIFVGLDPLIHIVI